MSLPAVHQPVTTASPRKLRAWIPTLLWLCVLALFSTDLFSAEHTGSSAGEDIACAVRNQVRRIVPANTFLHSQVSAFLQLWFPWRAGILFLACHFPCAATVDMALEPAGASGCRDRRQPRRTSPDLCSFTRPKPAGRLYRHDGRSIFPAGNRPLDWAGARSVPPNKSGNTIFVRQNLSIFCKFPEKSATLGENFCIRPISTTPSWRKE